MARDGDCWRECDDAVSRTGDLKDRYDKLKRKAQQLQAEGKLSTRLTCEEVADWAYGNAVIENSDVTREMAEHAAAELFEDTSQQTQGEHNEKTQCEHDSLAQSRNVTAGEA